MASIIVQIVGLALFGGATVLLGRRVRRGAHRATARQVLRRNTWMSWICLGFPLALGFVQPGWSRYDALLGLAPLPFQTVLGAFGFAGLFAGAWLLFATQQQDVLWRRRSRSTVCISHAAGPIRQRLRHPRSLALYVMLLSGGLAAGSTAIVMGGLLVLVPMHVFNLLHVVERGHERLYGSAYAYYRRHVPVLLPSKPLRENEPVSVD